MKYICFFIFVAIVSAAAFPHSTEGSVSADRVVTVKFKYNTGEPMSYVQIKVFSPSSPKTEVISGFTDNNGRYAFVADENHLTLLAGHQSRRL